MAGNVAAASARAAAPQSLAHHFTVDVEEYFQVSALEPYVSRSEWNGIPARVHLGTRLLLDLLAEHESKGTFFVLGWIAERHPELVREIAAAGHEIASHGFGHERVTQLTPEQFRESVRTSKQVLEDVVGAAVLGYRAPSFSIIRGGEWALDILLEEGYTYDSSLYPVRRAGYGFAGGARDPHPIVRQAGTLQEFPPATWRVAGATLPAGGGAYFRLLPYGLMQSALQSAESRRVPATFYIHPWELDPAQPRLDVPIRTRLRHYGGLHRTVPRLQRMLSTFRFQTVAQTLATRTPAA
jgi:polysaccharide deacetylase family protein (PEP-CTERM system associated)